MGVKGGASGLWQPGKARRWRFPSSFWKVGPPCFQPVRPALARTSRTIVNLSLVGRPVCGGVLQRPQGTIGQPVMTSARPASPPTPPAVPPGAPRGQAGDGEGLAWPGVGTLSNPGRLALRLRPRSVPGTFLPVSLRRWPLPLPSAPGTLCSSGRPAPSSHVGAGQQGLGGAGRCPGPGGVSRRGLCRGRGQGERRVLRGRVNSAACWWLGGEGGRAGGSRASSHKHGCLFLGLRSPRGPDRSSANGRLAPCFSQKIDSLRVGEPVLPSRRLQGASLFSGRSSLGGQGSGSEGRQGGCWALLDCPGGNTLRPGQRGPP